MKTKKVVINKLSRGEIYGAMRLMKLGALLPLVRNQLENNLEYADLSFEDRIGTILYEAREQFLWRQLERVYRNGSHAKPVGAVKEEIIYSPERNLNREVIKTLQSMDWVKGQRPYYVTICGQSGTGKSYLTEVLIREALEQNVNLCYYDFSKFMRLTEGLSSEEEFDHLADRLNRKDLIIIEDIGLFRCTEGVIKMLFRLLDKRLGSGALLFTSQYQVEDWYEYFAGELGDNGIADAMMERLKNNSQSIELKGPSLRVNRVAI